MNTTTPKSTAPIILENKKLHDLILDKDVLVAGGRKISQSIEFLEKRILRYQEKEKAITGKVEAPKELSERGDFLSKKIEEYINALEKIAKEIKEAKMSAVPKDMIEEHQKLLVEKEQLERERNKVALKVQKIKDKIIPVVQKYVKPLLGEYDDIETAKAEGGKITITTFNHLDQFREKFRP